MAEQGQNTADEAQVTAEEAQLDPVDEAQLDIDAASDIDSGFGDEVSARSASLTSSIENYTYSNGRRYHAYRAGAYPLPNDEGEQDRMDFQHHIWRMILDGNLHISTNLKPKRILDVGTGTGIWAIDMADEHPDAEIIGVDLSPIQPTWSPPNCRFYVDDVESPWTFEVPFDFIHIRALLGSIADWPKFYEQVMLNLEPGGVVEVQEHDAWIYSLKDKEPPWIAEWNPSLLKASELFGKYLNVAKHHKGWLEAAGFEDVNEVVKLVPIGKWSKSMKEIGIYQVAQMTSAIEPFTLALYTRVLGKSLEETQTTIEMIKQELKVSSNQLYITYRFITARKPIRGGGIPGAH